MQASKTLKTYFREHRDIDNYAEDFRLRIHRAISWLEKSEQAGELGDLDTQFITLWISFNAAYARELVDMNTGEHRTLNLFLHLICQCDEEQRIYNLVWHKFSQSIRLLIKNQFVYQPFWDYHNGKISEKEFQLAFERSKEKAYSALEKGKTQYILEVIFSCLYTLRNQILHGGATYNSSANRAQLKDGCRVLSLLIPEMLQIMMENHQEINWGKPYYPVVAN
ncbi:HEPN domain-containing protein [Rodentibacter trehalosifermentans]|uniref:HEPN domain-containing protein n=1 Tax=Rodentibacter trehalosifermentans TaxID=1908263 RepID=UPI000985CA18|nr:HEPN domain-containing protein [Rodentibacter trehalosifermentans]OOF48181.1 hypothetical protein BKK53_10025 [Rodentibacter trehalosifermentans]